MDETSKASSKTRLLQQLREAPASLLKAVKNNPLAAVITLLVIAYIAATMVYRFSGISGEFVADPDQRQAVFHYWRYQISGAFPPGDLLTDYAFVMHAPPFWWVMMAPLSLIFEPITAAMILNIFAFVATCIAAYLCCRAFMSHIAALAGAVFIAHSSGFHLVTAGGYARTFGPLLVLMFMAALMHKRHKTTLAVLVLQAGLYPSVVIPCGIAYGVYCIFVGDTMAARIRRTIEVSLTGFVVILLGLFQSLGAPDWWGSVVWESEALKMPVWGKGGRVNEAPLGNPAKIIALQFERTFLPIGHKISASFTDFAMDNHAFLQFMIVGFMLAYVVVRKQRIPLAPLGMIMASFAAYFLARSMAFKLYLPYRPLTHVLPYTLFILVPCLAFAISKDLFKNRKAKNNTIAICAFLLALVPTFIFTGDGLGNTARKTYSSYAKNKALFNFVRTTPLKAVYAGSFRPTDKIPLFGYHRVYINRVMAHPFRPGLYEEIERRVEKTYRALYAKTPCELNKLADEEVAYFVFQKSDLRGMDNLLFEPVGSRLAPMVTRGKKDGFYLEQADPDVLVFEGPVHKVIDLQKLRAKYSESCALSPEPPVVKPFNKATRKLLKHRSKPLKIDYDLKPASLDKPN